MDIAHTGAGPKPFEDLGRLSLLNHRRGRGSDFMPNRHSTQAAWVGWWWFLESLFGCFHGIFRVAIIFTYAETLGQMSVLFERLRSENHAVGRSLVNFGAGLKILRS